MTRFSDSDATTVIHIYLYSILSSLRLQLALPPPLSGGLSADYCHFQWQSEAVGGSRRAAESKGFNELPVPPRAALAARATGDQLKRSHLRKIIGRVL